MGPTIIIILFVVAIFLIKNWQRIARLLASPKPKAPPEQINTDEFTVAKPAGFYRSTGRPTSLALEIYSEAKTGVIGIVDGQSVKEEFNCAWAVVSVTPGDGLELCRKLAKDKAEEILHEAEETLGGDRSLTITVLKRSAHFRIETTHKVIISRDRNNTYELRASV
ncbi:MAG: hypothetical protein AAFQ57_10905, partial [Cyanobacteria bacterium J06626_14]